MPNISEVWKTRENSSTSGSRTLRHSDTVSQPRAPRENPQQTPFIRPQNRATIGPPHPTSRFFVSSEQYLVKKQVQPGPIVINEEDCYEVEVHKEYCLLGCFGGCFPGRRGVSQLAQTWPHRCKVFYKPNGFILFQFQTAEERDAILNGPDQFVHGKRLFLKLSPEDGDLKIEDFCIRPVWAIFPELPRPLWHPNALSNITSLLGDPICMDAATLKRKQGAQARALIYIDTSTPPRSLIPISWNNGSNLDQMVEYENWTEFCTHCDQNGHYAPHCPKKESPQTATPLVRKENEMVTIAGNGESHKASAEQPTEGVTNNPGNPTPADVGKQTGEQTAPEERIAGNLCPHPSPNHEPMLRTTPPPSPFGIIEAPMPSNGDVEEPDHPQVFAPEELAEVHRKMDVVHGKIPDEETGKGKKKMKKKAKPSEPKFDVISAYGISDGDTDDEFDQSKSKPVHLAALEEVDGGAKQPNVRKEKTQKLKRQVEILFEAPTRHSLLLPRGHLS